MNADPDPSLISTHLSFASASFLPLAAGAGGEGGASVGLVVHQLANDHGTVDRHNAGFYRITQNHDR